MDTPQNAGIALTLRGAQSEGMNLLESFAIYERSEGLAATTIRNRRSILTGLAHGCDLATATVTDLRVFLGRDISAGSRRSYRGCLVAFYTWLQADGYRDDNPALRLPAVRAPKGEPRPFTQAHVDAMLGTGAYKNTRAMILLGCYQGFRVSQIAAVRGEDVDLMADTIRTVSKGGKERRMPLHPTVRELARTMPKSWWFPARRAQPGHVKPSSVSDLIRRAKARAGIVDPHLTAHSLRHMYATELSEAGVDILTVSKLMLHESVATTMVYAGVSEQRKRAAVTVLPVRGLREHSGRIAA